MANICKLTISPPPSKKNVTLKSFGRTELFFQNHFVLLYTNISNAFKYILSQNKRVFTPKKTMHSPATMQFPVSTFLTQCTFLTEDDALS